MKRHLLWSITASCSILAGAAFAQSSGNSAQAQGQASGTATSQTTMGNSQASTQMNAQASANAQLEAQKRLEAIKEKGAKIDAQARAKAEAKLESSARSIDAKAETQGDLQVAGRLAKEFGMTADALLAEKAQLETSWGQLLIAHTLSANATSANTPVSVEQLFDLRADGMGWGQIAAGLGFNLGSAVSAVQSEGRVAAGLAKPDGTAASMRPDLPRSAGADAGVKAGAALGSARVGTDVSGGVRIGK
jgi:hypothetical protein